MKRCPQCGRDYNDDSLSYCLDDGSELLFGPSTGESATAIIREAAPPREAVARAQVRTTEHTAVLRTGADGSVLRSRGLDKRLVTMPLLVAIIGLGVFFAYRYFKSTSGEPINSIAVLPFANASGDPNTDYLSDGISETLINSLSQITSLKVIARSTVFRYKGRDVDPQLVGHDLDVRAILTGRVRQVGDSLNIQVDLVDALTGAELWGEEYDRRAADLVAVKQDIAREVTNKLKLRLTGEQQKRVVSVDATSPEAYQLYLKGRYFWNQRTPESLRKSIDYLEQAAVSDPNFALAYAGIADAYNVLPGFGIAAPSESAPKAKAAAKKALEIDDSLAEAHTALASTLAVFDRDWPEAEREFRRAIELNPNYASGHYFYAIHYLIPMRRIDESLVEMKRAQELEPLSLIINTNFGTTLTAVGRCGEAVDQLQKAVEINPSWFLSRSRLALAYACLGNYNDAVSEAQRARSDAPDSPFTIYAQIATLAGTGRRDEALRMLNELETISKRSYVSFELRARVHLALGDKEQALYWIGRSIEDRGDWQSHWITVDHIWDPLRSDPRFTDLIRRMAPQT